MRRWTAILLLATLLSGCREGDIRDYWNVYGIDYTDVEAAQDRFAIFAEKAVAAPQADALDAIDILFDKLKEDEVAYYLYTGWVDGAFYTPLSPCRNAALYAKAVERMTTDGILSPSACAPYIQRSRWIEYNREGAQATIPGFVPDGRRMLVLVLDMSCPTCREALTALAAAPEWADILRVAVCCGYGPQPDVPGWDYLFPENAADVFDPQMTPVYFVVSAEGTVETSYTLAL